MYTYSRTNTCTHTHTLTHAYKVYTVGVKLKFPFTVCRLKGNSFSCVFSEHTTDKLNMCSVISTS